MPQLTDQKRAELQKQFKALDLSRDGRLSKDELAVLLRKGNRSMSDAQVQLVFAGADKNSDGTVDFDEFITFIYQDSTPKHGGRLCESTATCEEGDWEAARATFVSYSKEGVMQQVKFCKVFDDCKCFGGGFSKVQSDIIFDKVKTKGKRNIDFEQFKEGVRQAAAAKKVSTCNMVEKLANSSGPKLHGTAAEAVRFHDDKSSYTGMHSSDGRHGGSVGLAEHHPEAEAVVKHEAEAVVLGADEDDWRPVDAAYDKFAGQDGMMDGKEFKKVIVDCGLNSKDFPKEHVDTVFAKVAGRAKKVGPDQFQEMLRIVASKKKVPVSVVQRKVAASQGPSVHATHTEAVRFHDDKSSYTGVHGTDGRH